MLAVVAVAQPAAGSGGHPEASAGSARWILFPSPQLELRGLPWFAENAPELWRLPRSVRERVPARVWSRAVAPGGGRIRFSSTTARLSLRVEVVQAQRKPAYFDAYVDGERVGSAGATGPKSAELVLFSGLDRRPREITIYLPHTSEVRVVAIGIDADAHIGPAAAFALPAPVVCYGSSVLQGTGADHPAQTYPAVLARRLNLDFVNFGFGGAGKAEPDVVALINRPAASAFLLDLGKSYGPQSKDVFARMLADLRAAHPTTPIVCVTPIYSTKEAAEPGYRELSENLRALMRHAALERRNAGDRNIHVIEGPDLFGPADQALFKDPLHPNDAGNERMGDRLAPTLKSVLFGKN
ncbi:MAG: hypothetical protein JNL92_16370 [Opitutaceae bacterium]|nr:hypothetical protein [Opitutaceae bacterium]